MKPSQKIIEIAQEDLKCKDISYANSAIVIAILKYLDEQAEKEVYCDCDICR